MTYTQRLPRIISEEQKTGVLQREVFDRFSINILDHGLVIILGLIGYSTG